MSIAVFYILREGEEQKFHGSMEPNLESVSDSVPSLKHRVDFQLPTGVSGRSFTRSLSLIFKAFYLIMLHRIILSLLLVATIGNVVDAQNRTHRRRGIILGGLAGAALGVAIGDKGDNETAGALIGAAAGAFAGGAIGNQKDQRIEQEIRWREGFYGNEISGSPAHAAPQRYGYGSAATWNHHSQPQATRPFFQPRSQPATEVLPAYNEPYVHPQGRRYLAAPNENSGGSSFRLERQVPRQVVIAPTQSVGPLNIDNVLEMQRSGVSPALVMRQIENHGFRGPLRVAEIILLHKSGVSNDVIEAMQIHSQAQASTKFATPSLHDPMSNTAMEDILPPPATPSQ